MSSLARSIGRRDLERRLRAALVNTGLHDDPVAPDSYPDPVCLVPRRFGRLRRLLVRVFSRHARLEKQRLITGPDYSDEYYRLPVLGRLHRSDFYAD